MGIWNSGEGVFDIPWEQKHSCQWMKINSGEPEVNFKYSLSQIPFLCVYSVYYKSLWDLKKKTSFKKYIKTQIDKGKMDLLTLCQTKERKTTDYWLRPFLQCRCPVIENMKEKPGDMHVSITCLSELCDASFQEASFSSGWHQNWSSLSFSTAWVSLGPIISGVP